MRLRPVTECRSGSDDDAVDSDCQRGAAAMAAACCLRASSASSSSFATSFFSAATHVMLVFLIPTSNFNSVTRSLICHTHAPQ